MPYLNLKDQLNLALVAQDPLHKLFTLKAQETPSEKQDFHNIVDIQDIGSDEEGLITMGNNPS